MKTGSGNTQTQAIKDSLDTVDVKTIKTEVAFSEEKKQALQKRISQFIHDGKEPADVLSTLVALPEYKLLNYSDFLKLVQTVAATVTKSSDLSDVKKASAEKLLNFVEKKIEEESKGANKDSKVPTAGNQNPKSDQASPNGAKNYTDRVEQERAAAATLVNEGKIR